MIYGDIEWQETLIPVKVKTLALNDMAVEQRN